MISDTYQYGGGERHTADLGLALTARGHEARLACIKPHMALLDEAGYAALRPVCSSLGGSRYLDLQALSKLRRLIAEFQPDVLLASNLYALMYASFARSGRPLVGVFHSTVLRSAKEQWQLQLIYRHLVRRTSAFVFLCEFQAAYWNARGLAPPHPLVIYNGIDTRRFHPGVMHEHRLRARHAMGVTCDDLVIGCNAMLRPEKNHRQLLQAVAALRQQGLPVVAALLGDGPERAALQAQAAQLGITDQVRFLGRQTRVEHFLAGFDVGVLPSVSETFSLAALEQMALGLPMVMSDQGGAREMLVDGEHGYIVPTGHLPALTGALARLQDPALRAHLGAAAAANVAARFDSVTMVDQYSQLFRQLSGWSTLDTGARS